MDRSYGWLGLFRRRVRSSWSARATCRKHSGSRKMWWESRDVRVYRVGGTGGAVDRASSGTWW